MQRPSYRRACQACVKAKRKCDLQSPRCSRCSSRDLSCAYGSETDIYTTPEPLPSLITSSRMEQSRSQFPFTPLSENLDMISFDCHSGVESGVFTEIDDFQSLLQSLPLQSPLISWEPTTSIAAMCSRGIVNHLIRTFKSYPTQFLQQFRTPFLHPHSYHESLPKPIQDALLLCSAYSTKTAANNDFVFRIFEYRVKDLIQEHQSYMTFADHLAFVQSLILIQIIQLFDGDIRQRAIAEEYESVLVHWTEVLQEQVNDPTLLSSLPSKQAWYMAESARRTIIMSIMLRAVYSMAKNGFSHIPGTMGHLPFTPASVQWDGNSAIEARLNGCDPAPSLVNYSNFSNMCKNRNGESVRDLHFEKLLLVACMGDKFILETCD